MASYMEGLIPIVNRVQDTFASIGMPLTFDLPQIAVVGSQSAGKSSVLENIVGRDFLPRGSGIVTRRPLVLQLIQHNAEYAEFLHVRDKKFYDFDHVRREIEEETDRLTGSNKNISSVPINLRVYSPNVLNLTLIDLPGITKVPIGDQPPDIEIQIRKMIEEYIRPESCLILAVTPANSDLANSDALKLAKEVDPQGLRTIGVLTKLDLMDEGTDARDILENKVLPLRRGFIGVVNRSQKDIDGKKNIKEALENERKFFTAHPSYCSMADRCGTVYLQRVLHKELTNHIKESLPSLARRLQRVLATLEPKVAEYGKMVSDNQSMKNKLLSQYFNVFCTEFGKELSGAGTIGVDMNMISGGAKINKIFHERFPYEVYKLQQAEPLARREIAIAIRNIHGINTGLFTPDMAFETVVRARISRLLEPSLSCVDHVVQELLNIVYRACEKLKRFPNLQSEIERIATEEVKRLESCTKEQLETQINIQLAYMNTNHEDFIGAMNAVQLMQPPDVKQPAAQNTQGLQPITPVGQPNVIRKGWLTLLNGGFMKSFGRELWFVLTNESLIAFKDSEEKERKMVVALEGLRVKNMEVSGVFSKKQAFALFYPDKTDSSTTNLSAPPRNVFKDFRHLELSAASFDDTENWKASFLRVNVFPVVLRDGNGMSEEPNELRDDIGMEKQVDLVSSLVESYCRLVTKMHRDIVPKTIAYLLVNKLREFYQNELLLQLYSVSKADDLTAEPEEEKRKREETVSMYSAIKDALKIINDVNLTTLSTPLPPPVVKSDCVLQVTVAPIQPVRKAPPPPVEKSSKLCTPLTATSKR